MTNKEDAESAANEIRETVRRYHPGGGEQALDQLVALVPDIDPVVLATAVNARIDVAWVRLDDESVDRQCLLEDLILDLRAEVATVIDPPRARVTLFKAGGKYHTTEEWRIPANAIGPWDMQRSPDFRSIDHGPVLVETQEPWGCPFLLLETSS